MKFTNALFASTLLFAAATIPTTNAGERKLDPTTINNVTCTDPSTKFVQHQLNVAQLKICGGIGKPIESCQGSPKKTTGDSGNVQFQLEAIRAGDSIDVSKGRWEAAVFAAKAICGPSPFTGIMPRGAGRGKGSVRVTLVKNEAGSTTANATTTPDDAATSTDSPSSTSTSSPESSSTSTADPASTAGASAAAVSQGGSSKKGTNEEDCKKEEDEYKQN